MFFMRSSHLAMVPRLSAQKTAVNDRPAASYMQSLGKKKKRENNGVED